MDKLKEKVREIVPENKKSEVDLIFKEWIASLRVQTIPREAEEAQQEEEKATTNGGSQNVESSQPELNALKEQFKKFKKKMKMHSSITPSKTNLAISEVEGEIEKVRKEVLKMKLLFKNAEKSEKRKNCANDEQLIKKLDEIKDFLGKLK